MDIKTAIVNSAPDARPGSNLHSINENGPGTLKYVSPSLVDTYKEKINMSDSFKKEADVLAEKYHGDDFREISGGNENVDVILRRTIVASFDEGVKDEHSFTLGKKKYTEPGHAILGRKAMLTILKERAGLHFDVDRQEYLSDKKFRILTLDLAGFREADLQGAGDYDLNIFTRQINLAINTISKKYSIDPRDLVVCRYGGDEFYVAIVENNGQGKINLFDKVDEVKDTIIKTVSSAKGFFGENKETNFKIKDNKIDEIDIGEFEADPIRKTIFLDSLTKDLILGEKELDKEVIFANDAVTNLNNLAADQTSRTELITYLGHRKNSIYPEDIRDTLDQKLQVNKKIQFLISGHDELRLPYILAEDEDAKESIIKGTMVTKRSEKLLHFYENFLIDPLLNEIVMSRTDLFGHIENGEFTKIYAYEIKAKEINDNLSFVYCDNTIKALWEERFKEGLAQAIKGGKVKIGRIGGLLVVGATGKGELDAATMKILNNQVPITSKFGKEHISHEIGYAEINIPTEITDAKNKSIDEKKKDEAFKVTIKALFNEPTKNWLRKTFNRIINDSGNIKKKAEKIKNEFDEFIGYFDQDFPTIPDDKLALISVKYFDSPKRSKNRIPITIKVLEEMKLKYPIGATNSKEIDKIIEVLNNIMDRQSVVKTHTGIKGLIDRFFHK